MECGVALHRWLPGPVDSVGSRPEVLECFAGATEETMQREGDNAENQRRYSDTRS